MWVTPTCKGAAACHRVSRVMGKVVSLGSLEDTVLGPGGVAAVFDTKELFATKCGPGPSRLKGLYCLPPQQTKPHWWSRSTLLGASYPRAAPTPCGARSVGAHPITSTGPVKMGGLYPAAPNSDIKVPMTPHFLTP